MSWFSAALPSIGSGVISVIKGFFGLKDRQADIISEGIRAAATVAPASAQEMQAIASIVAAEAASEHWLTANWRPIVMLVLVGPIILDALEYIHMTEKQLELHYTTVQLGIGGYIGGRTVEKVTKIVMDAKVH